MFIFLHNHNYQVDTGKFIYKALILDNKQLLSKTIYHKATQVSYTTRIAFFTDSLYVSYTYVYIYIYIYIYH